MKKDCIIEDSKEVSASEILHSLPDAVFTTDSQMRINYFNKAAIAITGFRQKEALGMYCKDVLKSDICETECLIKKALDSKKNIYNFETVLINADSKKIPILTSASLLYSSSEKIIGYMHVFRDISYLKYVVSALEKSRNDLILRNLELDKALKDLKITQEQLLHAQKMESMGTLAGGIAHDFNNILSGILGYSSLLKTKIDPNDPIYRYVDTIEQSAVKSSRLTQKLLAFSRAGAYKVQIIDLNLLIKEFLDIIEQTIKKKVKIKKAFAPDLWNVKADASQIEQALMNLCINASEAMPDGGALTIKTENFILNDMNKDNFLEAKNGKYVKISIWDTGPGIPKDIIKKIFDPFYSTKDKGTGLGLSVVYGVVKNHGGYIDVKSGTKDGAGASFEIILPISKKRFKQHEIKAEYEIPKGSETILFVDDEELSRNLGKEILGSFGYTVILASNGFEAVEIYKKEKDKIDLVILDIIMPKMDGTETYRHLKKINSSVKVLISSGYYKDDLYDSEVMKSIAGFIHKPYKLEELSKKVRDILDK